MPQYVRRSGRQVNIVQALAMLLTFVLLAVTGGLLTAGLVLPLAAGASTVTDETVAVFNSLPDELTPGPLSQKSTIYDKDGNVLTTFYAENRTVVPLDEISLHIQNAVVATEDKRFFAHGGVDMEGVARALLVNVFTLRKEGASTLTQQYVKNVLIELATRDNDRIALEEANEDSAERKMREAKLAISVEKQMSKLEILERYLNIAAFGASVYGVESAANYYFGKHASELSIVEAATIAGITQAPTKYDPVLNPENNTGRRNIVLDRMYAQGYITREEHEEARATALEDILNVTPTANSCEAAGGGAYFCSYVTQVVLQNAVFGDTIEERRDLLLRGGLEIHTTLDSGMQQVADAELRNTVPEDDPSGVGDALVSVEPGTGKILAMAQNRTFVANSDNAQDRQTSVNYSTDAAHGGSQGFQAGSTFKVFVLAEWLKSGRTLNQTVDANRHTWKWTDWNAPCPEAKVRGAEDWNPRNSDGQGTGQRTVLQGTETSINTVFANMQSQLNMCDIAATAYDIGFRPSATIDAGQINIIPSMTLGTQNTSPLAMASAYATFASGGTYCEPIAITSVVDSSGNDLQVPEANCRKVLDDTVVSGVNYALQRVLTDGGAKASQLADNRPAAGKTGSTNLNMHTWFVGYTPHVSTAVWLGYPNRNSPMQNITINGQSHRWVFGSTLAAPTWKRYMDTVLAGAPLDGFGDVSDEALNGKRAVVPRVWGRSVAETQQALTDAGFSSTVASGQVYSQAPAGSVAYTYPTGEIPVGTTITIYVSNGQPAPVEPEQTEQPEGDDSPDEAP
ncbi:MAG: penicillin-binding protein [Cellulomonadaceae bacterium]